MQEIARRLDVTATEAFRQLERLNVALLVHRQPDGTFALGEYGKLVLQISTSLDFIAKRKEYFQTHDLMRLPAQFVNRLGELSGAIFGTDTIESLNKASQAFTEAEQYAYGIGEGTIPGNMTSIMGQRVQQGIEVKMLILKERLPTLSDQPSVPKNVEIRGLFDLPAVVVVTEKAAGVCFCQIGGRIDYAGFYGNDPTFHNWVKDLFLFYWEKGKRS